MKGDISRKETDAIIVQREQDLDEVVCDLLATVFSKDLGVVRCGREGCTNYWGLVPEVKEYVLDYLAERYPSSIWRPTYKKDPDTGKDNFIQFPYRPTEE